MCNDCIFGLKLKHIQECPYCYKESELGNCCVNCKGEGKIDGLLVMTDYHKEHPLIVLLHLLKYESFLTTNAAIRLIMQKFLMINHISLTGNLCPIPISKKKLWRRGFNQTEVLLDSYTPLLKRVIDRKAQMTLNYQQRKVNLQGVFEYSGKNPPKEVWLFDDVATTLSTLEEAAKTLKMAGVQTVKALVLARQKINYD